MATQQYRYPSSATVTVAAIGENGDPIPSESILIGGEDPSGDLQPLQVDVNKALIVSPLTPSSIVTANQGTPNTLGNAWPMKLTDGTNVNTFTANGLKVDGSAVTQPISAVQLPATLGQKTMSASMCIAIASDQSAIPVSASSLPLPTGAATAANQTNASQKTQVVDGSGNVIGSTANALNVNISSGSVPLPSGAATAALQSNVQSAPGTSQTVALTVQGNASGIALPISAASLPLPTGAATSANQTNGTQQSKITDGTNVAGVAPASTAPVSTQPALVVALSPNSPTPSAAKGRSLANAPTVTTYATPITSSAYTTIIASTTSATNLVELFDSSGVALYFAVGAAGVEVNQFVIYPGGNGQVPLSIPAGSRISYKAVSTSASGASAYNVLNLYT